MIKLAKKLYWTVARIPHVTTTYGHDRIDALRKAEGIAEDDRAKATWVEYYKDDALVHRSVNIALKQGIDLSGQQADLGG